VRSTNNPFRKGNFIYAFWSVGFDGPFDVAAIVWRETTDTPCRGDFRFRYHASSDPRDPNDRFSCYQIEARGGSDESAQELILALDGALNLLAHQFQGRVTRLDVNGNGARFAELLRTQSSFMSTPASSAVGVE